MSDAAAPFTTRLEGPAPEVSVSRDIVRRGLMVAPVLVAVCGVIWGVDGAWSSAYAIVPNMLIQNTSSRTKSQKTSCSVVYHFACVKAVGAIGLC